MIYNFCDYAGIEFDYDFNHLTSYGYDKNAAKEEATLNTHAITLALSGAFDFLWEEESK